MSATNKGKSKDFTFQPGAKAPTSHSFDPTKVPAVLSYKSMSGKRRHWSEREQGSDDEAPVDDGGSEEDDEDSGGDDSGDGGARGKGGKKKNPRKRNQTSTGRRKIAISYIDDKSKRHVSFAKRKAGLMKKAFELSTLTGTQCMVVIVSETGVVYTFSTPSLKPVVDHKRGREYIKAALRGDLQDDEEDGTGAGAGGDSGLGTESTFDVGLLSSSGGDGQDHGMMQQDHQPFDFNLLSSEHHQDSSAAAPHHNTSNAIASTSSLDPVFAELFAPSASSSSYNALPPVPTSAAQDRPYSYSPASSASSAPPPLQTFDFSVPYQPTSFALTQPPHSQSIPSFPLSVSSLSPQPPPQPQMSYDPPTASASHASAYSHYSSRNPILSSISPESQGRAKWGAHGVSEPSSKAWKIPKGSSLWIGPTGGAGGVVTLGSAGGGAGTIVGGSSGGEEKDERRKWAKMEAEAGLREATEHPEIPCFIRAHSLHVRSQGSLPPPPSEGATAPPLEGIELTLSLFKETCEELGLNTKDQLAYGTKCFLERALPSKRFTPRQLQTARTHLILFFDFLESHSLISSTLHRLLTSFNFASVLPPSSSTSALPLPSTSSSSSSSSMPNAVMRKADVADKLVKWASKVGQKYVDRLTGECGVEGWFEVYRVRGNFVMLKEKELKGNAAINACLSPWKVRMPRALTPNLKIDDSMYLTLRQVVGRSFWVPTSALGFQTTPAPLAEESDIDPSSYAAEVERLEGMEERPEETIAFNRQVFEMLTRAKRLLSEGELSEEEDGV